MLKVGTFTEYPSVNQSPVKTNPLVPVPVHNRVRTQQGDSCVTGLPVAIRNFSEYSSV